MSNILIIENEDFLRNLYCEFLKMSGYEVDTAENGKDGLDKLSLFIPDLILLDIQMPVMDGIEFLSVIKEDRNYKNIPVFILTGITDMQKINKCLDLGAVGYMEKTTHPVELLDKIEMLLNEDSKKSSNTSLEFPYEERVSTENLS